MQLITELRNWRPPSHSACVTIGNFDGVHLGHQKLIASVVGKSKEAGVPSIVLTFDPHPAKVLRPDLSFKNIFTLEDRIEQISKLGPDFMVVETFTAALSSLTPEKFFIDLLIDALKTKYLFVGYDFRFGNKREGTIETLKKLCSQYGVALQVVPAVKRDSHTVSSTAIREALQTGDVTKARRLLGRPFYVKGRVERGVGRGKKLGFPTANVIPKGEFLPKVGVYSSETVVDDAVYRSVTNLGKNPTFVDVSKQLVQVETYILNFDKDIYGTEIKIELLEYLRDELKFKSAGELVRQIEKDIAIREQK